MSGNNKLDIGKYRCQQLQDGFLQFYVQMRLDFVHQYNPRDIEIKGPVRFLFHPDDQIQYDIQYGGKSA